MHLINFLRVAAFIMLPLFSFSQKPIVNEIFNKASGIKAELASGKILSCFSEGKIYFTNQSNLEDKKNRVIYIYDIEKAVSDSIIIESKKYAKALIKEMFLSIEIDKDKFYILTDYHFYSLDWKKNKAIVIDGFENDKNNFSSIVKLNKEELFLYCNYNYHPLDAKNKHIWGKYNITRNEITSITKMSDKNVMFSHYVNDWFSVYKGLIAYTETTDYNIKFYNSNFEVVDSIVSDKLDLNKPYAPLYSKDPEYSKDEMVKIMKLDDSTLTRIQKIFLLDSTHLMAIVKLPIVKKMEYHIWTKINGNWELTKTNLRPNYYVEGEKYDKTNNQITGFYGNTNGLLYVSGFNFYCIYSPFIENITTNSFSRKKDYDDVMNEKIRKKKIFYGIKKFTISCD